MRKIIEGDVSLRKLQLTELFDLSDVKVVGDFDCSFNNLTNLIGSPHTVKGYFDCSNNRLLTSLKGIPKTIGGRFWISDELREKFPEEHIRSLSNIKGRVLYEKLSIHMHMV